MPIDPEDLPPAAGQRPETAGQFPPIFTGSSGAHFWLCRLEPPDAPKQLSNSPFATTNFEESETAERLVSLQMVCDLHEGGKDPGTRDRHTAENWVSCNLPAAEAMVQSSASICGVVC